MKSAIAAALVVATLACAKQSQQPPPQSNPQTTATTAAAQSTASTAPPASQQAAPGDRPKVGDSAPAFTLIDQDGKQAALADAAAQNMVLVFYRGHW